MALDISLAQFNKIATGSYNAGQIDIKVGDNGQAELVKVNKHKIMEAPTLVVTKPDGSHECFRGVSAINGWLKSK